MVAYALHLVFATVQLDGLEITVDKPSVTHLVKAEVIVYCLIAADVLLVERGLAVKELCVTLRAKMGECVQKT